MLTNPTFWVGVAFFIFVGLLVYYRIPGKLTAALDARAARIREALEEAQRLREEAQALLAEYQRKQREADTEAESIIAQAKEEAEALAAEAEAKLKESLERQTRIAEQKIEQAEAQAMKDVRAAAADMAVRTAEMLIAKEISAEKAAALIDESIKEAGRRLD